MSDDVRRAGEQLASAVANAVGDGCIVSALEPDSGRLRTVAVAHRDGDRRTQLELLLDAPPREPSGWQAHVSHRVIAARLTGADATAALALAGPAVAAAILLPWRSQGQTLGLVAAVRDSHRYPYTRRDQAMLEQVILAAGVAAPGPPDLPGPSRLLDHLDTGVWVTDRAARTVYVNDALCRLLGVPAASLAGQPMSDSIDELPQLVLGRRGDEVERRDHRLLRPDGAEAWVAASSVPLTDEDGRRIGTVTTMTDVTERKRGEIDLRMRLAGHEAVNELSDWALSGEPVETLVHGIASAVADLLGAEHVAVAEATAGGHEVVPRAAVGWDPELLGRAVAIPADSPASVALEGDDMVVVGDLLDDASPFERSAPATDQGLRSAVYIGVGDGLGLISAHSVEVDAFADADLTFLRALARLLAVRWEAQPPDLITV